MVSIIVPVYNLEKYISYCLQSLIEQTYNALEIIVINDGSTDGSMGIIKSFAERDNRIKIVDINNGGVSNARNIGLDLAQGDFIAFVDGDDIVSKDYISYLLDQIGKDAVLAMCLNEKLYYPQSEFSSERNTGNAYSAGICAELLLSGKFCNRVWGALFRKEAIGSLRFLKSIKNTEDTLFLFTFLLNNEEKKVVFSNSALYGYFIRDNSASNQIVLENVESIVYVSDIIYELVTASHPEWKDLAQCNRLNSRFTVINILIRSNNLNSKYKKMYAKFKKEILDLGIPNESDLRLKVKIMAFRSSTSLYKMMVKAYYGMLNDKRRQYYNERKKVKL